jgi:hypothetical protein
MTLALTLLFALNLYKSVREQRRLTFLPLALRPNYH